MRGGVNGSASRTTGLQTPHMHMHVETCSMVGGRTRSIHLYNAGQFSSKSCSSSRRYGGWH